MSLKKSIHVFSYIDFHRKNHVKKAKEFWTNTQYVKKNNNNPNRIHIKKTHYRRDLIKRRQSKFPIHKLKIRVSSPKKIRSLCIRYTSEGFSMGRVWSAITVAYKDIKPISGGLFCESAFGPLKQGVCACTRTRWRSHPKFPRKLRRIEIVRCPNCFTKTMYSDSPPEYYAFLKNYSQGHFRRTNRLSYPLSETFPKTRNTVGQYLSEFMRILTFNSRTTKKVKNAICKCGITTIHICFFLSIFRICRICITSTGSILYGKITQCWSSRPRTTTYSAKKNTTATILKLVGQNYQPGFCVCGRTSTEVLWEVSIFCGYCGSEVSFVLLPRRYRFGYISLSVPIATCWYTRYEPRPLLNLTGFSHRLLPLIINCERIVAEESFCVFKQNDRSYFSTEFQPIQRLTIYSQTNIITTSSDFFTIPIIFTTHETKFSAYNHINLLNFKKTYSKIDKFYPTIIGTRSVTFPEIEVFVFPWYCLYRDRPLFSKTKKGDNYHQNIEGIKRLNKFISGNKKHLYSSSNSFNITKFRAYNFREKKSPSEKLGIRCQKRWIRREPSRTGGEIILARLKELNSKDWRLRARRSLKHLQKSLVVCEKITTMNNSDQLKYRRLLRTRNQILIRFRLLTELQLANLEAPWLRLSFLPFLPPDIRPIISLQEGKIMSSDVNTLYQRVIERNSRIAQIRRMEIFHNYHPTRTLYYSETLLKESLDCLFEAAPSTAKNKTNYKKNNYKSISQVLNGKHGRFRNNLLGKRVDYSGRSVIVPCPEISLHQCCLPQKLVGILFQPFFISFLIRHVNSKNTIQTHFQSRIFLQSRKKF